MNRFLFSALFAGLAIALTATNVAAESPQGTRNDDARARMKGEDKTQTEASTVLQQSIDVYSALAKGPNEMVPESVRTKAHCVAVLPNVLTGAAVVGGSHGSGVASCRDMATSKWSAPAFVDFNALSLGAQVGGKSSDIVLYFLSDRATNALMNGSLTLGADASVAAGGFGKTFDTSTHDIVAYSRSTGAFAGISLSSGNLKSNDSRTAALYGRDIEYRALINGTAPVPENTQVERFASLLPR